MLRVLRSVDRVLQSLHLKTGLLYIFTKIKFFSSQIHLLLKFLNAVSEVRKKCTA